MAHTSTTTYNGTKIKQERADEHEIDQLAKEMTEKNRQKMLTQATQIRQQNQVSQQALLRAGGQPMITYYFQRDKQQSSNEAILPKKVEEKKIGTLDEESLKGRFGWTTIHTQHVPYLYRIDEQFCSVRMVEIKLLNNYLNCLPPEITTCIHVRSYFITETEAKLLNDINMKHCDYQFGRDSFTTKDLVVRLSDSKYFYKFLDTCYKKLIQRSTEQSEYCGFVRINGESVVPYTVKGGAKFVPLFYFEGEVDTLKKKAEKIEGWELAYLKFCCKVQGIRNELFASDTCSVVNLEDVKQYFPKDTQFEDWWPQKTAEPMRILNSRGGKTGGNWTQRPPMPPPTPSSQNILVPNKNPAIHPKPSTTIKPNSAVPTSLAGLNSIGLSNINGLNNLWAANQWAAAATLINGQAQVQAQAQAQALAAAYANSYPGLIQNIPDHVRRLSASQAQAALMQTISATTQSGIRAPPQLVRSSVSSGSQAQTHTSASSRLSSSSSESLRSLRFHPERSNDPIYSNNIRVQPNGTSGTRINNISHQKMGSVKAPPPLIPVSNGVRDLPGHKATRSTWDKIKLIDVPTFRPDQSTNEHPYKVKKMVIENRSLYCINQVAYVHNDQHAMVAVQELIREFFSSASLFECTEVLMNVLSVHVYKANWHQVYTLIKAWGSDSTPDVVPLVKAGDLMKYLNQIKYIFQRHQTKRRT